MKRWAWLVVFLTGCVTVAPPSAVETAVAGTVAAVLETQAYYESYQALRADSYSLAPATATSAPPVCGCCAVPTCVPNVAPATGPAPTGTPPVATPTRAVTTPTRIAPVLTALPPATLDYFSSEARYCGRWGNSLTAQNWLASPAIAGGVNIRSGPGVNYAAVARMQDEEVFMVLRQYSPNAITTWLCVYNLRNGMEVYGWSAQLYQGTKLLDVLP